MSTIVLLLLASCTAESVVALSRAARVLSVYQPTTTVNQRRRTLPPCISKQPPLSVEYVLGEIGQSPQAVTAASKVAAKLSRYLGRPVPATDFAKYIKDPRKVSQLFSVRVADLVAGFAAAQAIADARSGAAVTNSFQLPQRVHWRDAPTYFDATPWEPEKLYGSLYRYPIPSGISSEQVRGRKAFGEILDRLALNRSAAKNCRFAVVYQSVAYSDFDAFVSALLKSGHKVTLEVSGEVADFLHLLFHQSDGSFREVRTEVLIRTGYFTASGDEIIIPAVHSHLIFRFAGPHVNTAVEFYQGTHGTHFYPSLLVRGESWVGIRKSATYVEDEAVRALRFSGLYHDLLHTISREDALFAGGYGQSGICNDTVAVIETLLNKRVTVYPLLIDKRRVLRHLDALAKTRPVLAQEYQALRQAVVQIPSDVEKNDTQRQRILDSIPYPAGNTPYSGFNDARRTFVPRK